MLEIAGLVAPGSSPVDKLPYSTETRNLMGTSAAGGRKPPPAPLMEAKKGGSAVIDDVCGEGRRRQVFAFDTSGELAVEVGGGGRGDPVDCDAGSNELSSDEGEGGEGAGEAGVGAGGLVGGGDLLHTAAPPRKKMRLAVPATPLTVAINMAASTENWYVCIAMFCSVR